MTEKEKAALGLLYNPNDDPELQAELQKDQLLCWKYNNLSPIDIQKREEYVRVLFQSIGADFKIEQPLHCDFGYHVTIGRNFFANYNLTIIACADVTIGDFVFIAPNCGIYTAGHPLMPRQRDLNLEYAYPVTIGNHVWIGANVSILPGVVIGDHTTIAAGSVVTRDIPAGVLAGGVPCRTIRSLFP